jgi:hypothetical protein
MKFERWMKFVIKSRSERATKFPPLPKGEGRAEGERDSDQCLPP